MAELAVSGGRDRGHPGHPPHLTDVTGLGVRASDGGSIYRPPNEERYCTLPHLDTEEQILTAAKRTLPQLISQEQALASQQQAAIDAGQPWPPVRHPAAQLEAGRAPQPGNYHA